MNTKKHERRLKTIERLEKQLSSGVKPMKEEVLGKMKTFNKKLIPLEKRDEERIKKEIQTLKSKV